MIYVQMILAPEASTIELSLLLNICANSLMAYSQDAFFFEGGIAGNTSTACTEQDVARRKDAAQSKE